MPQPKSSSGRSTTARKAAPKKAAAKKPAAAAKKPAAAVKTPAARKPAAKRSTAGARSTASRSTASKATSTPKAAPAAKAKQGDDARLSQLRELLGQAVVVPTERLQAVLDDARSRGHIDANGVEAIRSGLLKQAEEARGTFEAILERGLGAVGDVVGAVRARTPIGGGGGDSSASSSSSAAKAGATPDPSQLKANEVVAKLDGLTAAQLKKVRKQEEGGPARKSVLSAIDKRLS